MKNNSQKSKKYSTPYYGNRGLFLLFDSRYAAMVAMVVTNKSERYNYHG